MARTTVKKVSSVTETKKGDETMARKIVNQELSNSTKGDVTMENKTENKFNVFNYTYYLLAKAYLESGNKTEFTVRVRRLNDTEYNGVKYEGSQKVLGYLIKLGGLKIDAIKPIEEFDEMGNRKVSYEIKIKDFDIKVKAKSKRTNNDYCVLQNALGRAMMAV